MLINLNSKKFHLLTIYYLFLTVFFILNINSNKIGDIQFIFRTESVEHEKINLNNDDYNKIRKDKMKSKESLKIDFVIANVSLKLIDSPKKSFRINNKLESNKNNIINKNISNKILLNKNKNFTNNIGKSQVEKNLTRNEILQNKIPLLPSDFYERTEKMLPLFRFFRKINNANNLQQINNYNQNSPDISKLTYDCDEIGCEWCDKLNRNACTQCKYGYFKHMGNCFSICPKNYVANIYTRTCNVLDNTSNIKYKI